MIKIIAYLKIIRPHQFIKNGFVLLPVVFGNRLHDFSSLYMALIGFCLFCMISGCIYIINDFTDIEEDRKHPVKKRRPLASGSLNKNEAFIFAAILAVSCFCIGLLYMPLAFLYIVFGYIALNIAYSFFLKHFAIIDIVCIASGFVLRILAGGVASHVLVTPWIVIMTFLLALFLALAKRRDDLILSSKGEKIRKSLDGYSLEFVSAGMAVMASVVIVAYISYTVSPEIIAKHNTDKLYLSALWVITGLLRYMQITFVEQQSGSPTKVFFKDAFLKIILIAWSLNIYFLLY